jgi:predicted  nucleic acid-binding Zn-ribbon protein
MITTCTECGKLYEAGSEEQANEQERLCPDCSVPYRFVGRMVIQAQEPTDGVRARDRE